MRQRLRDGDTPAVRLFSDEDIAELEQRNSGVGCPANLRAAEEIIVAALRQKTVAYPSLLFCKAMESVPVRTTHVKKLLNDMKAREVVAFDLPPKKRVVQPGTKIRLL